jgi:hypothetical protein
MKCQNFVWFPCSWYGGGKKSHLCLSVSSLSFWCSSHSYVLKISWNVTYHGNSVDHSLSWEANGDTASLENSHILCTFEIHDWVGNPSLVYTPSQINQVIILLSNFLNIDFSIILPSVPLSSMWSLSVCSPYRNCTCISVLPHMCHVSCQSCSGALCSFLHLPLTSSFSATNFLLGTWSAFFPHCEKSVKG